MYCERKKGEIGTVQIYCERKRGEIGTVQMCYERKKDEIGTVQIYCERKKGEIGTVHVYCERKKGEIGTVQMYGERKRGEIGTVQMYCERKKGEIVAVHAIKACKGSGGIASLILEICSLLRYYAASSGNPSPTFRDSRSVSSSKSSRPLKMGSIGCPETSVKDYHTRLCHVPEECRYHQHRGGSLKSLILNLGTRWR
jgi:hypothetical protein